MIYIWHIVALLQLAPFDFVCMYPSHIQPALKSWQVYKAKAEPCWPHLILSSRLLQKCNSSTSKSPDWSFSLMFVTLISHCTYPVILFLQLHLPWPLSPASILVFSANSAQTIPRLSLYSLTSTSLTSPLDPWLGSVPFPTLLTLAQISSLQIWH